MKKIKAYGIINKHWKEDLWENPLFQVYAGLSIEEYLFPYALFETKKDALVFNKIGEKKYYKLVEVEIRIK